MDRVRRSENAPGPSVRGMGVDRNAAVGARFRASVPVEERRNAPSAAPASDAAAVVPALKPAPAEAPPKPEPPLRAASEPPVAQKGQSSQPADQPSPNYSYQTVVNVPKADLGKQVQRVEETLKETDAKKAEVRQTLDHNFYSRAQSPQTGSEGAPQTQLGLNGNAVESESAGIELQQVQRRLRLLVVLESRDDVSREKASKLKADAAKTPVEAPQPSRKKG
jgi:hypothetical protein